LRTQVFISHQWRDKQLADRIRQQVEELTTAEVWIDHRNLRPGDRIQDTIDAKLESVDVMLVIWTEEAAASQGVAEEVKAADRVGLRIIPCIVEYDDDGDPLPPLSGALGQYLGIDFHHFQSGVVRLASLLMELQDEKAGLGMADDPKMRMLTAMRDGANYLANYRSMKGVADERAYWVDQIVSSLEHYVEETGDVALASQMAAGLEMIRENDPDAYEVATARLAPLVGTDADDVAEPGPVDVDGIDVEAPPEWVHADPDPDMLDQVLAAAGPGEGHRARIEAYVGQAEGALNAMAATAAAAQSPAGTRVVQHLYAYLQEADDVIPDHHGVYGLVDDAWLILNTAFRLIESGALTVHQVPADWQTITAADPIVRALIPAPAMGVLEQHVYQMLEVIAAEVSSYQPWLTPTGAGYAPTMATGGSWEDQMNSALAGTGISVYD
jgi:hypothetical protein